MFNSFTYMEDINRLKIVLVEKKKTGKWLADPVREESVNYIQMVL